MYVTLGTDVELFAVDKDGNPKSLCGLIGGTKENPKPFNKVLSKQFAYQEDNVAVEFNIPPADNAEDWRKSISQALNETQKLVSEKTGLFISDKCAFSFDKNELKHPNALVFGCEPDYNAWSLIENKKPTAKDKSLRTAGGHIHVGCEKDMISGVRNMDLRLGVPSVLLDDTPESIIRRELYGKAGAMRPKPYGWEYRTLSNFWIKSKKLIDWVWVVTKEAVYLDTKYTIAEQKQIIKCINTGDKKMAENIIKKYGLFMP